MEELSINTKSTLASRWKRLLAVIIDALILFIFVPFSPPQESPNYETFAPIFGLYVMFVCIVQIVLLSVSGQTIGKKVLRIKIVRIDTEKNGGFMTNVLVRGFLNELISFIPLYPLVNFLFIFREDRRCIHDMIARTKVVNS